MTSAQHLASHVAAHTRSLGTDMSAQAARLCSAGTAQISKTLKEFSFGDAAAAAGYTVMSLYAASYVFYVTAIY